MAFTVSGLREVVGGEYILCSNKRFADPLPIGLVNHAASVNIILSINFLISWFQSKRSVTAALVFCR